MLKSRLILRLIIKGMAEYFKYRKDTTAKGHSRSIWPLDCVTSKKPKSNPEDVSVDTHAAGLDGPSRIRADKLAANNDAVLHDAALLNPRRI